MTVAVPPPADERAAIVSTTEETPLRPPVRPPASAVTAAATRVRQPSLTLPPPPSDEEKYSYIHRNLPYLTITLAVSAGCLIFSQLRFELHSPATWPFLAFTATYICYQAISLPVNFTGRGFDLAAHQARIAAWRPAGYPSVDIYLPICGELIAAYPGLAQAYVLDDGPSAEARSVSRSFGFCYVRRPDLRSYKKSGILRYAFSRTAGEHIVILDADFA